MHAASIQKFIVSKISIFKETNTFTLLQKCLLKKLLSIHQIIHLKMFSQKYYAAHLFSTSVSAQKALCLEAY